MFRKLKQEDSKFKKSLDYSKTLLKTTNNTCACMRARAHTHTHTQQYMGVRTHNFFSTVVILTPEARHEDHVSLEFQGHPEKHRKTHIFHYI